MLRKAERPLPILLRKRRRFALAASWFVLSVAVLGPPASIALAQSPATFQFDIRFVPREARQPVAYELVHGTPAFKVVINGKDVWALVDNKAAGSVIDESFARSLDLQLSPVEGGAGTPAGAPKRWRVAPEVEISIPGQIGMRAPVSAIDLSRLSAIAERPISLILGKEYFSHLLFLFTPANRELRLGPSGSLQLPADTRAIALQDDRPAIEVMIAGRPAVLAIDLGYNGEIALGQAAWDRLGMTDLPITPNASVNAAGSINYSVATEVGEVSFGGARTSDVTVALASAVPGDRDGSVGFGLLSRFNFALDVKARRLSLIPPFPREDEVEP